MDQKHDKGFNFEIAIIADMFNLILKRVSTTRNFVTRLTEYDFSKVLKKIKLSPFWNMPFSFHFITTGVKTKLTKLIKPICAKDTYLFLTHLVVF